MRRIFTGLLVVMVACALLTGCGSADTDSQKKVIRIGMECAYAPNNWQEDSQTATNLPIENVTGFYAEGYDVQMSKLIGEHMGAEVIIVKLAWEGLIEALNQGQIDMIIAGMADTETRKESINFSTAYSPRETKYVIVVNKNSKYANATTLSDFEGASILGQKGTRYDEVIDQIKNVDHLPAVGSVPDMISRLAQNTADGIVFDDDTADSYLAAYPQFKVINFADGEGFDIGFTGACVGMRKSDTTLLQEVNDALASISTETRLQLWETAQANMPQ